MKAHPLRRAVGHGEVLDDDSVAHAARERLAKKAGVVRVRLERDDGAFCADQAGQQSREDPPVRTDVGTGPAGLDNPGDGRLELRLVRPVALSEPSENRAHRGAIVTVNLRSP